MRMVGRKKRNEKKEKEKELETLGPQVREHWELAVSQVIPGMGLTEDASHN